MTLPAPSAHALDEDERFMRAAIALGVMPCSMMPTMTMLTTAVSVGVGMRPKISNIIICTKSILPMMSLHRSLPRISM